MALMLSKLPGREGAVKLKLAAYVKPPIERNKSAHLWSCGQSGRPSVDSLRRISLELYFGALRGATALATRRRTCQCAPSVVCPVSNARLYLVEAQGIY
jgi:hypothetical protein